MSEINEQRLDKKRIAKNTVMLYFRMFLIMGVGIYTSRVVLQTLGVSDYGIYSVVGGFVAMLATKTEREKINVAFRNIVERLKKH